MDHEWNHGNTADSEWNDANIDDFEVHQKDMDNVDVATFLDLAIEDAAVACDRTSPHLRRRRPEVPVAGAHSPTITARS